MGGFMVFSLYNIIIKVRASPLLWFYVLKSCSTACFVNQRVTWRYAKTLQKSVSHVWWVCEKALPLHPQSREMRQWLKYWKWSQGLPTSSKKNFLKNFFEKVWWLEIKSLPLHPLSKTIAIKKSSLKDLDMNKQVVQDLL